MKTLQRSVFAFIFVLFGPSLLAQVVPADLDSMLCYTLDSMRAVTGAKSYSAAIQFSDGAVWSHADGVSMESPAVNVTVNDAYLIGSVTKTITSACILQMADEGKLSLDDSLHKWLDPMPYIDSNITIRQLLQHTSGIYDVLSHPHNSDSLMADMNRIWTPEELIDRFISPAIFSAGTSWSYSNTNYFLLDMIINKVSSNAFYTELRNRFYTPLGLTSFAIPAFEILFSPVAHLWLDLNGDGIEDDAHSFYMSYMSLNSTAGAAGGYFATPTDCTKWMRTYMRGDLLSPATMAAARTSVYAPGSQGGLYGLGMMKNSSDFAGYLAYGHGGDLAYHASSWYFPEKDASITVMTNDNNKNSWTLLPVVRALLKTYVNHPPVAVSATNAAIEIKAYPNPFTNQFTVSIESSGTTDKFDVEIKDVCGKTVSHKKTVSGHGNMIYAEFKELETLPAGIYFVTIRTDKEGSKTIRIAK